MSYDDQVEEAIPATIYMFAAADDPPKQIDVSNIAGFQLPDPAGRSGGACTSALLQTLWRDGDDDVQYSWAETLELMQEKIDELGLEQIPQLSTSRQIDMNEEICITPPDCEGVKRAMLIGLNYTDDENALTSCHNDVRNMKKFLMEVHGFQRENMMILMDDGNHHEPTKQLILDGLRRLCEISQPGDCIFFQFSGHGGQALNLEGNATGGNPMDEVLFPGDFKENGHIKDDEIYSEFISQAPSGVHVVAMVDCCHSGTAMNLPYVCGPGEGELRQSGGFKPVPGVGGPAAAKKKTKAKDKKQDKGKGKKKASEKPKKVEKQAKAGKKKKEEEEEQEEHEEEEEEEEEEHQEVERPVEPKKKKGLFGGFGRKKK